MCDLNVVETEKHFLLQCPYYNDQRNSLFVKIGYDANLLYFNDSTFIDIVNITSLVKLQILFTIVTR